MKTPGSSADAVVWAEVTQRSYEESELNWSYLTFLTLATVLAAIAIVVDSTDPGDRRDDPGPGIRDHRRTRGRPRPAAIRPVGARHPHLRTRIRRGDRLHDRARPGRPGIGMDHHRRCDRATAGHPIHLHPGQVVVHRRGHRGHRRCPVTHLAQIRRADRRPDFGHHRAGSRKHRIGSGIRRRLRGLGQHPAAGRQRPGHGALAGWAALAFQQAVWSRISIRRARSLARRRRML